MSETEATKRAFDLLGGAPDIAKRFGITNQAAQKWKVRIPAKRVREVEELTGVASQLLRPDIFGQAG